jgi:hypothetical protein
MKVRTRQLPNDMFVVEVSGFTTGYQWVGAGTWEGTSKLSIDRGTSTKSLCTHPPGDNHYATLWHKDSAAAKVAELEIRSLLGEEKEKS